MGRGVVHRKVQTNKRRLLDASQDPHMAATHYALPPAPVKPPPDPDELPVIIKQKDLRALLARLDAVESRGAPQPAA